MLDKKAMTVYVVQEKTGVDITDALRFGEFENLLRFILAATTATVAIIDGSPRHNM